MKKTPAWKPFQRQGRALFGDASYGGTVDISAAYHFVHMKQDAIPHLGFEWEGQFYRFLVLPFGLATAPLVLTAVMGRTVRFLRYFGDQNPPLSGRSNFRRREARDGARGPYCGPDAAAHPPPLRLAHPPNQVRGVRRTHCPFRGAGNPGGPCGPTIPRPSRQA